MSQSAVGEEGAAAPFDASTPDFSEIRDWFALLKPRVMTLVVFTGFIGMLVAPGSINPLLGSVAVLCIAVGAGAAGAINMWYDRDIDAVMRRTANRPIPAGRIRAEEALAFGVVLAIASVVVMGLATNWMAAGWLAGSILFYVFVYTMWLKRRTPQNIVIGGAAGAFPPVIGWAAVTGSVDLLPLLLFAIVFAWTPPHFWSLSLWAHGDYQRAGVPMLPVVAGAKETRRQIMLYTLVLFPLAVSPWPLGLAGPVYGVAAVLLGLGFVFCAWKVLRDDQDPQGRSLTKDAPAKRCFRFSLLHLALLFAALAADRLILG
ncbi:Protoheme IX farnesyltransferase [Roseomonas mucosa]|uniref:Protoheme IX farnesyltransferase n=1 Tax=Roseomonas mucosa TaxID=207340 RepID=A0A4Y1MV15_9PROT|nr:Protoheme IX farnesyltransferase [Roseomonas mucosa]QDJ08725.1 Protoheme IX farnesyltransferase [Roseomonas mucosa]